MSEKKTKVWHASEHRYATRAGVDAALEIVRRQHAEALGALAEHDEQSFEVSFRAEMAAFEVSSDES